MYILRLDDACEHWNKNNWHKMHNILLKYNIKPLVAIIPFAEDEKLLEYPVDDTYLSTIKSWINEGWTPALHGYNHVLVPSEGGLNPVNSRSEFVGLSFEDQKTRIENGYEILCKNGIIPKAFVAPAHTFDEFTLEAIKEKTDIQVISDTIANDIYYDNGLYYVPQQSGRVREMRFKIVTFCYHPNTMSDDSFKELVRFLEKYSKEFVSFEDIQLKKRKKSFYDKILSFVYFSKRKI